MMAQFIGPLLDNAYTQYLGRGDEITALYEIEIADDSHLYDSDASYTVPHGDGMSLTLNQVFSRPFQRRS